VKLRQARVRLERAKRGFEWRRERSPFTAVRAEFYRDVWNHAARAVGGEVEELGEGFLRIHRGDARTVVRGPEVMLDTRLTLQMAGDKPLTLRLLNELGYPTPSHLVYTIQTLEHGCAFRRNAGTAVVVKPAQEGAAGNGVTMHVRSDQQLVSASVRAATWSQRILVEEEKSGSSYRLLFLNGELIDAVRKDPPMLQGDGRSTVRQLIQAENDRRLRPGRFVALHPLTIDLECRLTLEEQGLRLSSTPSRDQKFIAKAVVNQNAKEENHIVRDEVHTSYIDAGRHIAAAFPIQLMGLDVLTHDIGAPLRGGEATIHEVNTTPGLHHHIMVAESDKCADVPTRILEYLLTPSLR